MRKNFSLLFLLLIGFSFGYSQTFSFMPSWQVGETFTYSFSKIKTKYKTVDGIDNMTSTDTSSYNARFEILKVSQDQYTIKMTKDIEEALSALDTIEFLYLPEEYKNIDVIYTTNRNGEIESIVNWEEIAKNMQLLCDSLLVPMYDEVPTMEKAMQHIKQLYSSQESIQNIEFTELLILHWLYGAEMEVGYSYPYGELLPNAWAPDQPLHAQSITGIDTILTEQSICRVKRYSYIDEKESKRLVQKAMQAFAQFGMVKKTLKKETKGMKMYIADDYTFDYSTLEHKAVYIHTQRTSEILLKNELSSQLNELIIQLLD